MTDIIALPRLEIGDVSSQFDEAVIWINGHEEETIRIECEAAGDLADRLIRYVNAHEQIAQTLVVASEVLRRFGAVTAAAEIEQLRTIIGDAA
jgi:hypothetical protein